MAADSVHGNIGPKMRKNQEVINFSDLENIISSSSKKIRVAQMNVEDFLLFSGQSRARNTKKVKIPKLCEISVVKFIKGAKSMLIKKCFSQENFDEIDFLKPKFSPSNFPDSKTTPRGIAFGKKEGILRILSHIPGPKSKFFVDMPVNDDSVDLVENSE